MSEGEIKILVMLCMYLGLAFTLDLALACWERGRGKSWLGMIMFETLSMLLAFLLLFVFFDALASWGF